MASRKAAAQPKGGAGAAVEQPKATPGTVDQAYSEFGATGLKQYSGYVREEWLRDLVGRRGLLMYREMRDNDPIIGAMFFAVEMLLRGVSFHVEATSQDSDSQAAADFVESCLGDTETSWAGFLAEVMPFLQFGWDVHEIVYKIRKGDSPDPKFNSKYDDGMIGWRKFAHRGQETLLHWIFDAAGDATHLVQLLPTGGPLLQVPLDKCLHFRTTPYKANPEGRALAPETMIPTPDGWRELDDLQPGDKVFDERGCIRYVTARADWENRPCYRLTFGDGSEIIADANHQWVTQTVSERSARRPGKKRTTAEIADRVKNTNGVSEHGIAWADALDYPQQSLPIDPYVLGLWLGDGTALTGAITCHADDVHEQAALVGACGYQTQIVTNGRNEGNGRLLRVYGAEKWARDGFSSLLSALGLRGNKHIPDGYLRGSATQRMALLAGLMDSDGHVDGSGRCAFDNTDYGLASGTAELVRSLGIGARIQARTTDHGTPAWRVTFTPTWAPFRIGRKAARCRIERQRKFHYITRAEPVAARRTVCIEVDSPSHLFLAGEAMVPTHNSVLRNAYTPYYFKKVIQEIEAIGVARDLTGLTVVQVPAKWFDPLANPTDKQALQLAKELARDTSRNQQEGLVIPIIRNEKEPSLLEFDVKLLATGGRRQFATNDIISRYDSRIAMTMLADFITLGSGAGSGSGRGSYAQSKNKTDIFSVACIAFLDLITAEFNRKAIPDLLALNGMKGVQVQLAHGDIQRRDLQELGTYLMDAAQAGVLTPDPALEAHVREEGGLPPQNQDSLRDLADGQDAGGDGGDDDPAGDDVREPQGAAAGNPADRNPRSPRNQPKVVNGEATQDGKPAGVNKSMVGWTGRSGRSRSAW